MDRERKQWLSRPPREELSRKLRLAAWIFSAVAFVLVAALPKIKLPLPDGWDTSFQPPLHAILNTGVAIALVLAIGFIKRGKVKLHRAAVTIALALSALFFISYVTYHITSTSTRYGGDGPLRTVYLILLSTHILSAAVSLPFILFTYIAGFTNRFAAHRRLAHWVFPLWLYVAITGPLCYLMLRPYYH